MGTSLTQEFGERLALLLVAATGVAFALAALFDSLPLRRQNRRAHRPLSKPVEPIRAPHQPGTGSHRPSVHV
ncbi:hypothetical protein [Streptomyces sp. NPDC057623]|uniref:hypothetical protein n=1 Tax=Streptomyces sp. NPDC057623 TaxID=3346187 RepID=UPI0036A20036